MTTLRWTRKGDADGRAHGCVECGESELRRDGTVLLLESVVEADLQHRKPTPQIQGALLGSFTCAELGLRATVDDERKPAGRQLWITLDERDFDLSDPHRAPDSLSRKTIGVEPLLAERMWVLQPAPSPLRRRDRGHDSPQSVAGEFLHLRGFEVEPIGRSPDGLELEDVGALPGSPCLDRHLMARAEPDRLCTTVFLRVHARRGAHPGTHSLCPAAPQATGCLSADEVVQFLKVVSSLKSRAALTTEYAAGLS